MLSSMPKLNHEKKFIIFGSHGQLKKLDSYLPVRIFGNLLNPSAVVKNLGLWFDANFSFADHIGKCPGEQSSGLLQLSFQKSVQFQHGQIAVYSKHTW